jgi:hypothetical protein
MFMNSASAGLNSYYFQLIYKSGATLATRNVPEVVMKPPTKLIQGASGIDACFVTQI